jgi:hypothetical protein
VADETGGSGSISFQQADRSRLHLRVRAPADRRGRLRIPQQSLPPIFLRPASASRGGRPAAGRVLLSTIVVAAIVYSASSKPMVSIAGTPVTATRVLVLRDVSGSMANTGPTLARQMATALAGGIGVVEEVPTRGFGFSPAGWDDNALKPLERVLPGLDVDAVYLFSDFDNQTGGLDDSDAAGLDRLRSLLDANGIRLYLATVRLDPDPALVQVAVESGGGVVGANGP